ncbi:MAG: hypothetical protein QM790_14415 [Nibricoccus sp.]
MHTSNSPLIQAGLTAALVLSGSALYAADAAKDADPLVIPTENYVKLSTQGSWVEKDKEAYQARNWTSKNGFFGIEDLQISKDLKGDIAVKADGHALVGNADYLAHINVSKNEYGSVDAGISRFRTFYDGVGGFFPNNNAWFPLPNKDLHVDRQKIWAGVTTTLPNAPVFSIRYTNEQRSGTKDSTILGDTDFTGIPNWTTSPTNPISSNRKLLPAYLRIGERKETLSGTVKHTVGKTTFEGSVVGTRIHNLNTRTVNRYYYPGYTELRPYPAITTTQASPTPPNLISTPNHGFDREGIKTDSIAYTGKVENRLTDKITVFAGVSYCDSTSDFLAERQILSDLQTNVGVVSQVGGAAFSGSLATPPALSSVRPPYSFTNFSGGAKTQELTANIGADIRVTNSLFVETALKHETLSTDADDNYLFVHNLVNQNTGVVTNYSVLFPQSSMVKEHALVPELNVRYNGIKNLSLFGSIEYRHAPGEERTMYVSSGTLTGSASMQNNYTNVKENHIRYSVGANWVPCSFFNVRAETFVKDHRNNFNGVADNNGLHLTGYGLGTSNSGAKLNITVKPIPTLSFITRYVYQKGQMDVTAIGNPISTVSTSSYFPKYDSGDSKSHNIGETINWNPIKQFYMQASANIVFDTLSTAYPRAGGAGNLVVRNSDNNYWNGSILTGFAVDKVTNAEIQYTMYKANNYEPLYATVPYGAGTSESTFTVGAKRKLSDSMILEGKIGYLSSKNDTTGGFTNYNAVVAYISVQQSF